MGRELMAHRWRRLLCRLVLALAGAVLGWQLVKEFVEPQLLLRVDDWLRPKAPPLEVTTSGGITLRLYQDTRPHTGKIAGLQKGLVLVVDGRERIEEGFGLGLPLVEVNGQAVLSRSASVERVGDTLVKRYQMDTIDAPSRFLRPKYEPVSPLGTVIVSYTVTAAGLDVTADFSHLGAAWDRAYLLNEQGARFFTRYQEAGLSREGTDLGIWQPTTAQRGCIVADACSVKFCVETENRTQRYYGRERLKLYYWGGIRALSWAGIDLEVSPPAGRFSYRVSVERPGCE
jgi:hypothetical protein